jgi:hypothetical protein
MSYYYDSGRTHKSSSTKRSSNRRRKKQTEFSKILLIQESILIWIITLSFIFLAFFCVINSYFGELPWLAAMVSFPWGAYGVSQAFYYKKATAENTKEGIKYETTMEQLKMEQEVEAEEAEG